MSAIVHDLWRNRHRVNQQSSLLKVMSTSYEKRSIKRAADERGHKHEGKETARAETPSSCNNNRTLIQEDPLASKSSGMKQTDVLSCLMSAQEKEKQNLCLSTDEKYGRLWSASSVEKFESYPIEKTAASGTT